MPDCENFDNIQLAPNAILNTIENSGNDPDSLNISEQKRKRYEQNTLHRNFLVHWVAWVVSLWLLIVINVIIANAKLKLGMESEVQITLGYFDGFKKSKEATIEAINKAIEDKKCCEKR